jgi:hypothetical protein
MVVALPIAIWTGAPWYGTFALSFAASMLVDLWLATWWRT